MNQDLNESKESAQSMERYLQNDQVSLSPAERVNVINQCKTASSILKLQNGKYSNQQTVFKEALDKKKLDLHKKTISQSSTKNLETKKFEKPVIKQDKVRDNIKAAKEFKKKEKIVKPPVYASIEQKPPAEEPDDAVFLEFVDRAYGHEKRRKQQIEKSAAEAQQKELDTIWTKPFINERSCKLLEKKLKQIVEVEEDYNKLYHFKEKQIQVDLMPNLPKLRDALKMNCYAVKKQEVKEIEIIKEQNQNNEALEQDMDAPQYKDTQVHQNCQTEEIKFRIGDTIKKSNLQEQQQQVAQFQIQDTPKKAVNNQRQKRLDIMESKVQTQRVKTECAYYVPIHERYNQVIDKKDKWIKQQVELKKQKEEEQYNTEMLNKSLHIEVDPEEFVNNQMSWLDKKNDHILTERIKRDKEMLTNLTFRPQISQKSNKIVNTSKVEDRLMDYQSKKIENLQKLESMYLPTFQPNLQAKQVFFISIRLLQATICQRILVLKALQMGLSTSGNDICYISTKFINNMNYYGTDLFGTPYMQFMSSKSAKTADNKTPSKHRSMEHLLKSPCIQVLIRESLKKSVEQSPKHQTQYVISTQHVEMIKSESPHNNSIAQFPKIERFSNIHLSKPKVKKQKDPSSKKVHLPKRNAGRFQMFAPQNDGLNTLNISAKPIHFKKMKINDSFLNQSLEIQKQEIIEQLKQRVKLQQKEERRAEIKQSLHQKVHREPISQTTRINQIKMEPIVKKQKKKPQQKFDGIYFKDPKYPQDPIFQEKYASMRSYFNIMNLSNKLFVQPIFNSYKAYVSKGNNGMLVRMILKNRWWWSIIDEQEQCHFVWTQLKVNTIHDNMKALIKNSNESFSCVSASSSTLTTVGSIAITKQDEQSDTEVSVPKSGIWNKFLTHIQLRKLQSVTSKNAKLLTLEKAQQFEQKLTVYNEPVKVHNHLENNFHLGNKKALFYNMRAYYENQGLNVFNSLPLTFHVKSPDCPEYNQFVEAFKTRQDLMIKIDQESQEKKQIKNIWIIKPGEITNRGNGIRISEDLNEIISILNSKELHKNGSYKTYIVQLYIDRPLLYNKRKFDIRCYSMMTSINGNQKGYWYTEGYVRTSSKEFSNKNLTNKMVHLTNDAIQKKGEEYGRFERGNKVSFDEFNEYVANLGGDFNKIYARMKQMATDEFRSVYGKIDPNRKENTFEIFGLDFMIDDSFDVWIIEVNTNPSIEICCPLLSKLIPQMLDNAFKIALDPIFPPPNFYNPKKIICDQYIENKFELVFDEERDGPQLSNENPQYDIGLIEEESEEEEEDVPQ